MNDLRVAFRQLLKNPGCTAVAVLTLGLRIALTMICGCAVEAPQTRVPSALRTRLDYIETTSPQALTGPVQVPPSITQPSDPLSTTRPTSAPIISAVEITLLEVRAATLRNNLDVAVELINPQIARQFVDEEEAKFDSTFFGSASYGRAHSEPSSPDERLDLNLGLRVPLRTGGAAIVRVPFARSSDDPAYNAGLQFSISQPLLRNAGVRINTHSILIARLDAAVVDARTKLEMIRILANADRVYWRLYAARAELRVRQQQYELAVRQLNEARKRVAAQAAPRIEITRAESGAAARLEAIIVSETRLRSRERDLKRIMRRPDLPPGAAVPLAPATEPTPMHLTIDPEALAARGVANRMEMLEVELRLAADASEIDFARNQTLPLFVLDYTYAADGSGDTAGRAFTGARDLEEREWLLSLRGEIPVGNEAAKARLHRAILQRVQRLATREQRQLAIEQEVFDAADQVAQDWQRILASRNETRLAGRTYEAERRQFELGVRTSTDVLDAAERLASAQSGEIQALADYQIAQIDLAFATGTLLGHDRISMRRR